MVSLDVAKMRSAGGYSLFHWNLCHPAAMKLCPFFVAFRRAADSSYRLAILDIVGSSWADVGRPTCVGHPAEVDKVVMRSTLELLSHTVLLPSLAISAHEPDTQPEIACVV